MKLWLIACVILGVLHGWLSAAVGINPIALALGLAATLMMSCCMLAPLMPDYNRFKDQRQQ